MIVAGSLRLCQLTSSTRSSAGFAFVTRNYVDSILIHSATLLTKVHNANSVLSLLAPFTHALVYIPLCCLLLLPPFLCHVGNRRYCWTRSDPPVSCQSLVRQSVARQALALEVKPTGDGKTTDCNEPLGGKEVLIRHVRTIIR